MIWRRPRLNLDDCKVHSFIVITPTYESTRNLFAAAGLMSGILTDAAVYVTPTGRNYPFELEVVVPHMHNADINEVVSAIHELAKDGPFVKMFQSWWERVRSRIVVVNSLT